MSAAAFPINQAEIVARSIDGRGDRLPAHVAQFFLDLQLSSEDRALLDNLAEKARQGTLTPGEEADLDEYRRAGRFVELMKLKAQFSLE